MNSSIVAKLKHQQKMLSFLYSPERNEVYTPLPLVKEMLDKLPTEVWGNPNLRWCNPCCKNGAFLVEISLRLMEGLKSFETDENRRFKHIMDNMIYGYTLNNIGLLLTRKVFGGNCKNISVLPLDKLSTIKETFDVVVGNPPFSDVDLNGNSIAGQGMKSWEIYIQKSINILVDDGILCMISPQSWRTFDSRLLKTVFKIYNTVYMQWDIPSKYFSGVRVDWYVIEKKKNKGNTIVYNGKTQRTINLEHENYFPTNLEYIEILNKIKDDNTLKFMNIQSHHHTRSHVSKTKKSGYIYPIKHSGAQKVWWSNKKHKYQNCKKVLVSYPGYLNPIYDEKLGVTQHCHFIFVNDKHEGNFIIKLLNSELYTFFIKALKTNGFNDIKLLNKLPYPKKLKRNFSTLGLYKYFNLSDEEIKIIRGIV